MGILITLFILLLSDKFYLNLTNLIQTVSFEDVGKFDKELKELLIKVISIIKYKSKNVSY